MDDTRIPQSVLRGFGLAADSSASRLGGGHIHATWRVDGADRPAVVQRLNPSVFPNPLQLIENATVIAAHLERRKAAGEYPLEIVRAIDGPGGAKHVCDETGAIWRAMDYVAGAHTLDVVATPLEARTAAEAFGAFAAALADLDPAALHVVLPQFHDLPWRIAVLEATASDDRADRAASAAEELRFCNEQRGFVDEVADLETRLPRRVCHNDTKIDNMLFDAATGAARAVIDLDTCMPGYWMHDYGDMVRTFCSPEPEDSTRLAEVRVRDDVFAALTEGFVAPLAPLFEPVERESLWAGARAMCLIIGVRFLTDWLDGDRYFATTHEAQNLDRARNQFALYRDLTERREELLRYVPV